MRTESDSIGDIEIAGHALWGSQTQRSLHFFNIGHDIMPFEVIRALIICKRAAACANKKLGDVKEVLANAIIYACDTVLDDFETYSIHFPLKVWQTGSGTQSHMNVNEVLANIANQHLGSKVGAKSPVHPNDHVNYGQSSNDSFPTAMHVATVIKTQEHLLPCLEFLWKSFDKKAKEFASTLKIARTHLQDATPMTVGQEFSAFARQIELAIERIHVCIDGVYALAQGGTAVGTGLNSSAAFHKEFITHLNSYFDDRYGFRSASNLFEALATHDALVQFSGTLNTLAVSFMKIGNDIRLLGSGPRAGLNELLLPENEPGSSIMPGKVNPTQAESLTMVAAQVMGYHAAISIGGSQGHLQLNVFKPMIILNVLNAIQLLGDSAYHFAKFCVEDIQVNMHQVQYNVTHSLMVATALNRVIGYDQAAKAAKKANRENISLKEAVVALGLMDEEAYAKAVKPIDMTHPR